MTVVSPPVSQVVEKNLKQALEHYRNAAERNVTAAMCNCGVCYEVGIGCEPNPTEAVHWYLKAARLEYPAAQRALAFAYEHGTLGLIPDIAEAVKWYQKAADHGNASAQYHLAMLYEAGKARTHGLCP